MNASHPRLFAISVVLSALAACGSGDGSVTSNPDDRTESTTSIGPFTTTTTVTTTTAADAPTTTSPNSSTTVDLSGGLLPAPDGSFAIGVRALSLPSAFAFYPAVAGTGKGARPYFDPRLLTASGLEETLFDGAVTSAEIDAQPAPGSTPRPVVIISSGFGSYLEFSTSLVERIASHGYVVIAVQPAVAAEAAVETPTEAMRDARLEQMTAALDYLVDPNFTELVGPIDLDRVAVGGHSYAGSIAFNTALLDDRVSAVFDLDGSLFDAAQTTATPVPSLILSAMGGSAQDERIASLLLDAPSTVAVGLLGATHFDLTDMPALAADPNLATALPNSGLGTIGPTATADTSTIVIRFLDAALGRVPRLPTARELAVDVPSAIVDPFAIGG